MDGQGAAHGECGPLLPGPAAPVLQVDIVCTRSRLVVRDAFDVVISIWSKAHNCRSIAHKLMSAVSWLMILHAGVCLSWYALTTERSSRGMTSSLARG
jgi:hypothetical protein